MPVNKSIPVPTPSSQSDPKPSGGLAVMLAVFGLPVLVIIALMLLKMLFG